MIHCTSQLAVSNYSEADHTCLRQTLSSTQATGVGKKKKAVSVLFKAEMTTRNLYETSGL